VWPIRADPPQNCLAWEARSVWSAVGSRRFFEDGRGFGKAQAREKRGKPTALHKLREDGEMEAGAVTEGDLAADFACVAHRSRRRDRALEYRPGSRKGAAQVARPALLFRSPTTSIGGVSMFPHRNQVEDFSSAPSAYLLFAIDTCTCV